MKKSFIKTVCLALTVTMLLTLLPSGMAFAAKLDMKTKNGYLDFEAEDTKYSTQNLQLVRDRKRYSDGGALSVLSENKAVPPADTKPDIDLSFTADTDGTYNVWLRAYANQRDSSGNSIFLAVGTNGYEYFRINGDPDTAGWTKLCTVTLKAGEKADIRLRGRQMNYIALDRFIITRDTMFKPDDVELGLASPTPTPTPFRMPEASEVQIKATNGYAIAEAEKLEFDKTRLAIDTKDRYSGGKGLSVIKEDKAVPNVNQAASLDLSFSSDAPGTYSVWIYSYAKQENDSGNSIYLSVNGAPYSYFVIRGEPETAEWTKLASVNIENAGDVASVRLVARQSICISFDKIIVTSNITFNPQPGDKDPDPMSSEIKPLPTGVYPLPPVVPPANQHPRLLFTKADIPTIKANMAAEQNKEAVANLNSFIAYESDGIFVTPAGQNHNYDGGIMFASIEAKAFDYAINGNEKSGKEAVLMMKNALSSADFDKYKFNVRVWGRMIYTAAKVYDWCYPLLSEDDKTELCASCGNYAQNLETGYPPKGMGAICGHGAEAMLIVHTLAFAIATYDEHPDIYNYTAGRFFAEFVPARNYLYKSGAYHQGSAYLRYGNDLVCAVMFKKMLGIDIYDTSFQKLCYETIYRRRPDGQVLRSGDEFNEYGNSPSTYWSVYGSIQLMGAYFYNDPYLKREYQKCDPLMASPYSSDDEGVTSTPLKLIINDPTLVGRSKDELPKTFYTEYPTAEMIARTGWTDSYGSPDVMAYTKIGGRWAANHEHLDAGHFQLYYKGILASDSGYYGVGYGAKHDYNYHKRSIAHNIITVFDPNEKMQYYGTVANDGGQRTPKGGSEPNDLTKWLDDEYETGEVIGQEAGPNLNDPEYSYIAGDITKAYSDKVSQMLRSTVLLPLDDKDHPAAFVVFDKVTSKDASFKKSWLLHMQEEPTVDGNKTIVTRTTYGYNGRMVNETLLPKSVNIEKIGGADKQFWVNGENYTYNTSITAAAAEVGWGRVEVSPTQANETDYFLNVMTVSDADTKAEDIKSTLIEGANYAGAIIENRVAVFAKNKERIADSISFDISGSGNFKVFVAGLKAGTWIASTGESVTVSEEGGTAYFSAPAGSVSLKYASGETNKKIAFEKKNIETIGIKVKNMFIYSDVPAFIENDRTLVPMRAIFEAIDANVSWDEASATATATKSSRTVKITENSKTAYVDGKPYELDVPAQIKNDRFVVPVRFVSEAFNCKVTWDPFAECVYVLPGVIIDANAKYATITSVDYSACNNGEIGEYTYDNDLETVWSVEGDNHWICWGFDEAAVESVYIVLNKATERVAYFDLQYSDDAINWKDLGSFRGDGKSDGETFKFTSPVKAKYIRYICHGNSVSKWNAIKEIRINVQ